MKPFQTTSDNGTLWFLGIVLSLILLGITLGVFIKRRVRSQIAEKELIYQKVVEDLLFRLMFGKLTMDEGLKEFRKLHPSNLLSKVTTLSIISLHENYSGKQRETLEDFFVLSDLTAYSFKRIRSRKSRDIISGIRYLSTMSVREAFEFMKLELEHPHEEVKKEAFIGLIALQGMPGLEYFDLPDFTVDDVTKERIINQMKNKRFTSYVGVHLLLYSENESLVLLGARITDEFQLHAYYDYIRTFSRTLQPKYREEFEVIRERITKFIHP